MTPDPLLRCSMMPSVSCPAGAPPDANAEGEWAHSLPATCLSGVPSEANAEDEVQVLASSAHLDKVVCDASFAHISFLEEYGGKMLVGVGNLWLVPCLPRWVAHSAMWCPRFVYIHTSALREGLRGVTHMA